MKNFFGSNVEIPEIEARKNWGKKENLLFSYEQPYGKNKDNNVLNKFKKVVLIQDSRFKEYHRVGYRISNIDRTFSEIYQPPRFTDTIFYFYYYIETFPRTLIFFTEVDLKKLNLVETDQDGVLYS